MKRIEIFTTVKTEIAVDDGIDIGNLNGKFHCNYVPESYGMRVEGMTLVQTAMREVPEQLETFDLNRNGRRF